LKALSVRVFRHHRHRKRRLFSKTRLFRKTTILALLLFAAAVVVTWQFAGQQPVSTLSSVPSEPAQVDAAEIPAEGSAPANYGEGSGRPAYLYSVITGGIGSVEDLREIAERDPVVAQEFRGFDYDHARLVTVSEKQSMYVAYRMGDKVYWTRKKIALHPGETLISDGKIVARTRCGNRISAVPLGPPAIMDPLISDFDQPLFSNAMVTHEVEPEPAIYQASLPSPPPDAGNSLRPTTHGKRIIPLFFLPFGMFPGGSSSHTPLAVAPEPGTLLLLSSGLVGVYWKSRKSRRKR
jgi:hypothetical protein